MEDSKFWSIVHQVDWPNICDSKRPYDIGKERMKKFLPTVEVMSEFRNSFDAKTNCLYTKLMEWENKGECWHSGGNERSFGLGDDSFGDLIAHIVGLGQAEFEAVLAKPELAHSRARKHEFVESFSYCIPYDDDYAPIEERLAEARRGLDYWIGRMVEQGGKDEREVGLRTEEVAKLVVEAENISLDEAMAKTRVYVQEAVLAAQERLVADLESDLAEAQEALRVAQERLKALKG